MSVSKSNLELTFWRKGSRSKSQDLKEILQISVATTWKIFQRDPKYNSKRKRARVSFSEHLNSTINLQDRNCLRQPQEMIQVMISLGPWQKTMKAKLTCFGGVKSLKTGCRHGLSNEEKKNCSNNLELHFDSWTWKLKIMIICCRSYIFFSHLKFYSDGYLIIFSKADYLQA